MLDFGKNFAKNIKTPQIIELIGDVGAGKTTFVRGLAEGLKVKEPITSPSFTISKSYALPTGGHLIHYDFYRLQDPGLMLEDLSESLNSPDNIVIIEWGTSVADILPEKRTKITIDYANEGRDIKIISWYNIWHEIIPWYFYSYHNFETRQ